MKAMMSQRPGAVWLGAVGALGVMILGCALGACAASSKSRGSATPSAMEPSAERAGGPLDDPRSEIDRLWSQIEVWQGHDGQVATDMAESMPASAGGEPDSTSAQPGARRGAERGTQRGAARAAELCPDQGEQVAPLCTDVCVLGGSICDNADNICRIAGELAGDAWAEGKCDDARTACEQATERCCACRRGERPE